MFEMKNMVPDFDCRTIWHRTIWHQDNKGDNLAPDNKSGQFGTKIIKVDNLAPGQFGTRTIWHRTIWHQDNLAPNI